MAVGLRGLGGPASFVARMSSSIWNASVRNVGGDPPAGGIGEQFVEGRGETGQVQLAAGVDGDRRVGDGRGLGHSGSAFWSGFDGEELVIDRQVGHPLDRGDHRFGLQVFDRPSVSTATTAGSVRYRIDNAARIPATT
ncbi:MAG: hypothetical protein R2761_00560 [Acidimicrobiales bacterium]